MKNILYVAPYKQNDGWGEASKQYLKSIAYCCEKLGYDLQAKPIFLSHNVDFTPDPIISQYENNHLSHIDVVIQKALPQAIAPIYPYKNIAMSVFEQTNLDHVSIIRQVFNRMDAVLVPSALEQQTIAGMINKPVYGISQPIDIQEIRSIETEIENNQMDILSLHSRYKDFVKFYFVGSFVPRKNIVNLILAFNYEFAQNEKALLVIKTDKLDNNSRELMIKGIRETIERNKYLNKLTKNLILITDHLDRQNLLRLHNACDIFVCPSKGEAFCRPLAESICMGSTPIAVEHTGAAELIDSKIGGLIIPSRLEMAESNPSNKFLEHESEIEYSSEPTLLDIRKTLRKAYDNHIDMNDTKKKDLRQRLKLYSDRFSVQSIGEKICSLDIM